MIKDDIDKQSKNLLDGVVYDKINSSYITDWTHEYNYREYENNIYKIKVGKKAIRGYYTENENKMTIVKIMYHNQQDRDQKKGVYGWKPTKKKTNNKRKTKKQKREKQTEEESEKDIWMNSTNIDNIKINKAN